MAGVYQIKIEQGASFILPIDWKDGDGKLVPLGGYRARLSVRPSVGSTDVLMEANTANGRITFPQDGRIYINVPANITSDMSPGIAVYDLLMRDASGVVTRLLQGAALISAGVSVTP